MIKKLLDSSKKTNTNLLDYFSSFLAHITRSA